MEPNRRGCAESAALYTMDNKSDTTLVRNASPPGSRQRSRDESLERARATPGPSHGALGGGPRGYSGLAQSEGVDFESDPTQYDYFRNGSSRRSRTGTLGLR